MDSETSPVDGVIKFHFGPLGTVVVLGNSADPDRYLDTAGSNFASGVCIGFFCSQTAMKSKQVYFTLERTSVVRLLTNNLSFNNHP